MTFRFIDSAVDIQMAITAGMLPVGVLWGFRTEEELRTSGAEVLIERPLEILEILTDSGLMIGWH